MGSPLNLSGIQPRDGNNLPIITPATALFQDATTVPVKSPKASLDTTGIALVVPANATSVSFYPSAAANVSFTSATWDGSVGYNTIPATTITKFPCGGINGGSIYVAAVASTITLGFHFEMLA